MKPEAGWAARLAAALVGFSVRWPCLILLLSLLLGAGPCRVVATRFAMDTDVVHLFPASLSWRQAEVALDVSFPERIIAAQPLLGTLAANPSLRGVARTLEFLAEGLACGEGDRAMIDPALAALTRAAEAAAAGRVALLDLAALFTGRPAEPLALRRFLLVRPVTDYAALAPIADAVAAIRAEAVRLGLTPDAGVTVRLSGDLVMGDEEFATVFGGAIAENILSLLSVALLL